MFKSLASGFEGLGLGFGSFGFGVFGLEFRVAGTGRKALVEKGHSGRRRSFF